MKYILSLLFILSFSFCFSQKVKFESNINKNDSAEIFLLYADGQYKFISQYVSNTGIQLKLKYPIFAILKYQNEEVRLILSPNKSLSIIFDSTKSHKFSFNGEARDENKLLQKIKFGEQPNYTKNTNGINRYSNYSYDSLKEYLLPIIEKTIWKDSLYIYMSSVNKSLKDLIYQELKLSEQCNLYLLAQNQMRWSNNPSLQENLELIINWISPPKSSLYKNGFYANLMWGNHAQYKLMQLANELRKDSKKGKEKIESYLGLPIDTIKKKADFFGEIILMQWLTAKNNFPKPIAEKVLFNKIAESFNSGRLLVANSLIDTLDRYYPKSEYLGLISRQIKSYKSSYIFNEGNSRIKIYEERKKSLDDLIRPYLGKVIYLDIWGSWCTPCRIEMRHVKALHNKFIDKDVVFLYLAMDQDNKVKEWKEAIYFYSLEGEHYRVTREIDEYWRRIKELGGESGFYPTYLIIDREGKVVNPNAKRPSDGEELYKEISKVLK